MNISKLILFFIVSLTLFYLIYTPTVYEFRGISEKTILIIGSVHGNEPSGTDACYHLIDYLKVNKPQNNIIIIPFPNPIGYYIGSRYQLKPFNRDINRNFNKEGKDRISSIILDYAKRSDLIVDLHEGYEYHKRYPQSMGSSIIPNQSKLAILVSKDILDSVNNTIQEEDKKFVVSDFYIREKCYLPDSLGCWCNNHKKNYISIETTGLLMNKQSINVRVNQHLILLKRIINYNLIII